VNLDDFAINQLPIAVGLVRESDGKIIFANPRFRKIFLLTDGDIGVISARELVAPEHIARGDVDFVNLLKQPFGSESEQFGIFRKRNGIIFIGWTRVVRGELVGHGSVSIISVFEYYDEREDELNNKSYESARSDAIRAQMAQYVAENLNRTLAELKLVASNASLPYEVADQLVGALSRAENFAKRILGLGLMSSAAAESVIDNEPSGTLSVSPRAMESLQGARVAVIDDDTQLAELIESGLTAVGCSVAVAHSQSQAAVINPQNLDAAIIDLRLGADDGRDVAKDLRRKNPNLSILYITAFSHSASLLEMAGENLLRKPFSVQELHQNLIKVLSK
jgi:CheY-like chemotaxis protein